jgi:hypothetical protein
VPRNPARWSRRKTDGVRAADNGYQFMRAMLFWTMLSATIAPT